jgi:hypothetical protein
MGVEACADGSVSKVSLHDIFLLFCLSLDGVEFDSLPFYVRKACVLCLQGVDIGNDPWIAEVEQGVVDYEAIVGGWVEDGEICILQS